MFKGPHSVVCERPSCSALYINVNPLLRKALNESQIGESSVLMAYETIVSDVIGSIRSIVDQVCPTRVVYIAMDGPVSNTALYRKREQFTNVDLNCTLFLPGTLFMQTLQRRIRSLATLNLLTKSSLRIELSDSNQLGEGCVKIMRNVRENQHSSVVTCGLDSELTILCMSVYRPDIVMCEQNEHGTCFYKPVQRLDMFLTDHGQTPDIQRRCDALLLCMFTGNDFVRPFECTRRCNNGWSNLITAYTAHARGLIDITRMAIDFESMLSFMQRLDTHTSISVDACCDNTDTACDAYLMSVQWCWDYHTHGVVSWGESFFHPTLPNIKQLPKEWTRPPTSVDQTQPISPFAQMMYLLPSEHLHVLPDCMQHGCQGEFDKVKSRCDQYIPLCTPSERERNAVENIGFNCIHASSGGCMYDQTDS